MINNNILNDAPRFIRDKHFYDGRFDVHGIEKEWGICRSGNSVPINFFDAIKHIYKISMIDIAVLLNVSIGVIYRAKVQSISPKRVAQLADTLCVPVQIVEKTTTGDFNELEQSKQKCFMDRDLEHVFREMPKWKSGLVERACHWLGCQEEFARNVVRIDKLCWMQGMSLNEFTEIEKKLIEFMQKRQKPLLKSFEYSIGFCGKIQIKWHIVNEDNYL